MKKIPRIYHAILEFIILTVSHMPQKSFSLPVIFSDRDTFHTAARSRDIHLSSESFESEGLVGNSELFTGPVLISFSGFDVLNEGLGLFTGGNTTHGLYPSDGSHLVGNKSNGGIYGPPFSPDPITSSLHHPLNAFGSDSLGLDRAEYGALPHSFRPGTTNPGGSRKWAGDF